MKLYRLILFGALVSSTLTSCFREDDPVPPYVSPAGVTTVQASTKPDYSQQTYYDLGTNTFVASNNREDWDIAFSCKAGVSAVYLNGSKKMRVYDTQGNDWAATIDVTDATLPWLYDESTGEPENTAFHNRAADRVYILDLGLSTVGNTLGYRKMRFTAADEQTITFEWADFQGNNVQTVTLTKNAEYNFIYFTFRDGGSTKIIEPKKNTYDLEFTQYTTRVYLSGSTTEFEWYSVNGVLVNPEGVSVAVDSTDNFAGITYDDLGNYTFSTKHDAIGYDWKTYDINAGVYTILIKNTYLIQDRTGVFWKLRFTGFTNALGERGYPTFEVARF